MDKEKIIITIQVFNDKNNAFKISSSENITYAQLKQKAIEEFKVPKDNIKYMAFYYEDNEGNKNYIYENDELWLLAEEISSGNLLLKLNFEINLYESRKSHVSYFSNIDNRKSTQIESENSENEQKKLDKELYDSKINQLNEIIKEKNEEILKLKKENEKLKSPKLAAKINDQIFSKEKENDNLEFKNLIKKMENEIIENIKNKVESSINEINKSLNKIDKNQKLFESKIENIEEFSKSKTKIFEDLIDSKSIEIVNKTNENINNQIKKIEEAIANNQIKKQNEKSEFNLNSKNDNINGNNINDNENIFHNSENIIHNQENVIHKNENIIDCNENIINNNENIINNNENIINNNENIINSSDNIENNNINTDSDNNFVRNNKHEKCQNKSKIKVERISNLYFTTQDVEVSGFLNSDFIRVSKIDKKKYQRRVRRFS